MFLNNSQFIGSICHENNNVFTNGNILGSGAFSGCGSFAGTGIFSGFGYFTGSGLINLITGRVSGYSPGFLAENEWDVIGNGLSPITYSGRGDYYGTTVSYDLMNSGLFLGRNDFILNSGSITGDIPNTTGGDYANIYTGYGFVYGSGAYNILGCFKATGSVVGHGGISGSGALYYNSGAINTIPNCYGCFYTYQNPSSYLGIGDFTFTGMFSGSGEYKMCSVYNSFTTNYSQRISGSGLYTASGVISGFSEDIYYGSGFFKGDDINYISGDSFSNTIPYEVYGTGRFYGTGWIRGNNGVYSGMGTGKGIGLFYGDGAGSGLENSINRISGQGCLLGNGVIYQIGNTGQITSTWCSSSGYSNPIKNNICGPFTPFITDCSSIGNIPLDFKYTGDCVNNSGLITTPSEYKFTPFKVNVPSNSGSHESPDDQQDNSQCTQAQFHDGTCDPFSSGVVSVVVRNDDPIKCALYPPLTGYLFSVPDDFDTSEKVLLKSFDLVNGSGTGIAVDIGNYTFDISGAYGSFMSFPGIISQGKMQVKNAHIDTVSSTGCTSTGTAYIYWSGYNYYSIPQAPNYSGYSNTGFVANLLPGSYTIGFSRNGCNSTTGFSIKNGNKVSVQVNTTGVQCGGNGFDGIVQAIVTGGTPPYRYYWNTGDGNYNFSNSSIISGLGTGNYGLTVKDWLDCQPDNPSAFSIGYDNSGLSVNMVFTSQIQDKVCCQDSTGHASLYAMANGGTPPYTYLWNNGATTPNLDNISAGDYSVTVTDSKGCSVKPNNSQKIESVNNCYDVKWDFGDGTTEEYLALPGTATTSGINHNYLNPGTYNVKMMVADGSGNAGIACHQINIPSCPPHTITALALGFGTISPSGKVGVYDENNQSFFMSGSCPVTSLLIDGTNILPSSFDIIAYEYAFTGVTTDHTIIVTYGCDMGGGGGGDTVGGDGGHTDPPEPPNVYAGCCIPDQYGTRCENMMSHDCKGKGTILRTFQFETAAYITCEAESTVKNLGGCGPHCTYYPLGYCCTINGCVRSYECECKNSYGLNGTWHVDESSCEAECYCKACCMPDGTCTGGGDGQVTNKKLCVQKGGRCVSDCNNCQRGNCCTKQMAAGGCGETGHDCGSCGSTGNCDQMGVDCCCCPENQACGMVNGEPGCVDV